MANSNGRTHDVAEACLKQTGFIHQTGMMGALLWQVPLSLLSYALFRTLKPIVRYGVEKRLRSWTASGMEQQWRGLSEYLTQPGVLTYTMLVGPRWNTAAVLGSVGPLTVKESMTIDIATARNSAKFWSLVFYSHDFATTAYISSKADMGNTDWYTLKLDPGRYFVVLRYYGCGQKVFFPALKTDGHPCVPLWNAFEEKQRYQAYLKRLRYRRNLLFRMLHYYIMCLLQWHGVLPADFVRREYLPVGNPDTCFRFGRTFKGKLLQIQMDAKLLQTASIYLTIYNSSSLPVFWDQIQQKRYSSPVLDCAGHYLIRIHYHRQEPAEAEPLIVRQTKPVLV